MEAVITIVLLALVALIPAKIAQNKGRSFATWYVFGLLLWIVALIASLIIKDNRETAAASLPLVGSSGAPPPAAVKRCPECAEVVLADARVCKHCRHRFGPPLIEQ